jgi:ribosome-associated toxin RatA of RatAB toxin-antitoxin module
MGTVITEFLVPDADADEVFDALGDFERYAEHTDTVREVRVTSVNARTASRRTVEAAWAVNFRGGVLCWAERAYLDRIGRTIRFAQTRGDFASYHGDWGVRQSGGDVTVRHTAAFDLGMPSLAAVLEPIAERTLRANVDTVLRGLLGDAVVALDLSDSGTNRLAA